MPILNKIYHQFDTTSRGGGIRRGRRALLLGTNSTAATTTSTNLATLFHLILLVRVLLSFYGILGIMQQYEDTNLSLATTRNLEQLMDMPDHHKHAHYHLPVLQPQRVAKSNNHDDDDASPDGASIRGNDDNNQEDEIEAVLPFATAAAAAAAAAPQSVHATAALRTRTLLVSCGGDHFAPSCYKCPQGNGPAWCNGECVWNDNINECDNKQPSSFVHPDYHLLIKEYPFQPVVNENGTFVNVVLVRAPFLHNDHQKDLFLKYRDKILFLGISSYETFPLSLPNPYSVNFSNSEYQSLFPGFLTMMRQHPEDQQYFNQSITKTILMSQSDFNLDSALTYHDQHDSKNGGDENKKTYDFIYSGSDQDVDNNCVGPSSFVKNWTFVVQALDVMCGSTSEFNLTGVLMATKNKAGTKACRIPDACAGKIVQTSVLEQDDDFFHYLSQSKFALVPQVYDASQRVVTQALAMNIPVLMNDNIVGGWKYINEQTGEFFHDVSNFRNALRILLDGIETGKYEPRKFVTAHYGNEHAGVKLKDFVMSNWGDRVVLPQGTRWLIPSGV